MKKPQQAHSSGTELFHPTKDHHYEEGRRLRKHPRSKWKGRHKVQPKLDQEKVRAYQATGFGRGTLVAREAGD